MDNDICLHCNHTINETDKKMEMPCCETVYHTTCAKNMINEAIVNNYNNIICSCGELFISLHNWNHGYGSSVGHVNTVISDEARVKITDFRSILTQFKKNRNEFNKKIKEESTSFKEDVEPLLEQIKERRKTALDALKSSDLYKTVCLLSRNLKTKLTRIKNAFEFNHETLVRELYGGSNNLYYELRYSFPVRAMRRSFRLKRINS
jgi:gas vesicle protein